MTLRSILSRSVRLRTCALVALACGLPLEALAQPAPAAAPAAPTDPTTAFPDDPPPAAGEDPDPGIPALPPSLVPESEMPPPTAAPAPSTPSAATPPAASAEATADDVDAAREQFRSWAELGGGQYFDATSADELAGALQSSVALPYEVLDADDNVVARGNVNGFALELEGGVYTVRVLAEEPVVFTDVVVDGEAVALKLE